MFMFSLSMQVDGFLADWIRENCARHGEAQKGSQQYEGCQFHD
jgi:hypothetical protein